MLQPVMASVELHGLWKRFGTVEVLRDVSLSVADGEFVTLLGPSGCGKSTLLRIVAGLERQDAGTVRLDGRAVDAERPRQRNVAMVFQSYALYPHMSVFGNLALPLEMRRLSPWQRLPLVGRLAPGARAARAGIAADVRATAATLDIAELLERRPGQLSGGQKQRVAVGRALVRQPSVFLMDEPLSNLDAQLRTQMRAELIDLHRRLRATLVYVTHDQVEAMTMSTRVAVMIDGRILQVASPRPIYADPDSVAVAEFVGSPRINLLPARALGDGSLDVLGTRLPLDVHLLAGEPATVGVRPEGVGLAPAHGRGVIGARVRHVEHLGPECLVHADTEVGGHRLVARTTPAEVEGLAEDVRVGLLLRPGDALVFDQHGQRHRSMTVEVAAAVHG